MSSLADRVALVTGSGSGIGAATAALLADRGATVYGADLTVPEDGGASSNARSPARVRAVALDVREEADWEGAVSTILDDEGRLDMLVHAAGISSAGPVPETSLAEWRRVMATNLDGSFLAVRHGMRAMTPAGGSIVLIGSASGIRPSAGAVPYSTSKAAVGALARAAAKECRENGLPIRVNVVSPAGVRTPMWSTMPFFREMAREHGSEEAAFARLEATGGGRFAEAEDVAWCVAFLVSDEAEHITGVELPMDDGYTL